MIIMHIDDDDRRDIQSYCLGEKPSDIARWNRRLLEAHNDIADMFISQKPLIFFSRDEPITDERGKLYDGVYLTHPSRVTESSKVITVNDLFFDECLSDGSSLKDKLAQLGNMLDEANMTKMLSCWYLEKGLHCVNVYKESKANNVDAVDTVQ